MIENNQGTLFDVDFVSVIDKDDAPKATGNGRATPCYWLWHMDATAASDWARVCRADALASARLRLAGYDSGRVVVSADYHEATRRDVERLERESA